MKTSKSTCCIPTVTAWIIPGFCFLLSFLQPEPSLAQTEAGIIWGSQSNSLRAGLYCPEGVVRIDANSGKALSQDSLAIGNVSTNKVFFFWLQPDQRDDFIVTDSQGKVVPKTPRGESLWRPIDKGKSTLAAGWSRKGYVLFSLRPGDHSLYDWATDRGKSVFSLGNYFCLTNPGDYRLTRHAWVCFRQTNGVLKPVELPPVTVPVRVEGKMR